ncbi:hypothetical protein K2173_019364 [Erythroxylum novogranatense]|uniref:NAC domain-containing protein n=1 Tax=Erythroxylum novogranatense TaxID=1862640 RepID=A0AAV8UEE4_9ROSI|nr:hypothetical protein K2173_019364 [Erythroxylum novogranatense]
MENNNQQLDNVNSNNPCSNPVDEYFRTLPPGFRLRIFDDELVEVYLFRKVHNLPMILNRIHDVDLYNFHPQELTDTYRRIRSSEWYFFTHRYRKYPNGRRPRRAAAAGFWKPTGTDKPIPPDNPRGYRKCLDYYEGKHPQGFKTVWKMHEYTLISQPNDPSSSSASPGDKTKVRIYAYILYDIVL